ncbi:MAG: lipopolysaccharide biosynthesis protein [Oscillospiraceae bacterium]|jgi:O-antigen/teichoic acid export membrane protein|nr:lipopolysaccharide biosynthesis protein [Oscillospiraceae bacterium]
MNRKTSLVKNILIFGVGTSLSKLMSVLLVGMYTAFIRAGEMGYYDTLINVVSMVTPIISLQITDALYRNLLSSEEKSERVLTNCFAVLLCGIAFSTASLSIVNALTDIRLGWYLPGYIATSAAFLFCQQTARGLQKNTVYAVSGMVYTGVMLAANILLVVVMKMGIEALLISTMIADVVGIVLIEVSVGVFRRLKFSLLSGGEIKEMLRYSIPMLPNVVTWWLLMVFNRFVIRLYEGWDANGMFAVASKFPALLMTLFGVFTLAWQENAIFEYDSADRNEYYTKTFRMYTRLLTGGILLLLPVTRYIVGVLLASEYQAAWELIPFLYLGSMAQAFANFFNTVYMGAKRTVGAFVTMVAGVAGGALVCLLLIPVLGAQAAAIAHMTAFTLAWLLRVFHTRKYAHICMEWPVLAGIALLSGGYVFCYYLANPVADMIMLGAAVPLFFLLNRDLILLMLKMSRDFFQLRQKR